MYFCSMDFSGKSFEQIVKASYNWERLTFWFSTIHLPETLDFRIDTNYKIKHLSFQDSGNTYWTILKTDWMTDPTAFSKIVNAISESGLKESLKEINIQKNKTLNKENLQQEFNDKGMSHISIIEEKLDPAAM